MAANLNGSLMTGRDEEQRRSSKMTQVRKGSNSMKYSRAISLLEYVVAVECMKVMPL